MARGMTLNNSDSQQAFRIAQRQNRLIQEFRNAPTQTRTVATGTAMSENTKRYGNQWSMNRKRFGGY